MTSAGLAWLSRDLRHRLSPVLLADAARPLAAHLRGLPDRLRLFLDAQLLISAKRAAFQSMNVN